MARKSVKIQRSKEILDAFERCISKWGLDGASLERIATESAIKRPALRHFIGNRDELIVALVKSMVGEYKFIQSSMTKILRKADRGPEEMISMLLFQSDLTSPNRILVLMNLYAAAPRYPKVQKELRAWYKNYVNWVADRLHEFKPKADKELVSTVAAGLIGIAFNYASLAPLELDASHQEKAVEACRTLIKLLGK